MEKLYTINDLAMMTGLSARTLRNYLKLGLLDGEKEDGMWRFTEDDVECFLQNESVRFSLRAKKNAIVYEFLGERHKKSASACVILDVSADEGQAEKISRFFCERISQEKENGEVKFSFEKSGENVRIILCGGAERVYGLAALYQEKLHLFN